MFPESQLWFSVWVRYKVTRAAPCTAPGQGCLITIRAAHPFPGTPAAPASASENPVQVQWGRAGMLRAAGHTQPGPSTFPGLVFPPTSPWCEEFQGMLLVLKVLPAHKAAAPLEGITLHPAGHKPQVRPWRCHISAGIAQISQNETHTHRGRRH